MENGKMRLAKSLYSYSICLLYTTHLCNYTNYAKYYSKILCAKP